jgi:UDP:flavonoid glycosyltransferase YjiC (YdhE family)
MGGSPDGGAAAGRDGVPMTHEVPAGRPARVLFACVPATGHVTPLLPLAREFARRGCEVVVASGPDVGPAVAAAGLGFRPVCPGFDGWFATLAGRTPGPPGAGLPAKHVECYFVPRLFGEVGLTAMRDGLDALVDGWRPDLVVFEQHALAAPLVAAAHGVPAVLHLIGLRTEPLTLELLTDAVTPAWTAAGLPVPAAAGLYSGTTLTVHPPSLDPPPPGAVVQPLRTTPLPGPALPLPVELPWNGRPLVYVTLGTSFNEPAVFATVLEALADLPVTVLVTLGRDRSADELGTVPGNAVVAGFLPQETLLPHCAAVVHHGGAGTALGVLAHGLPSVVLPRGADNFALAGRMAAAGAARVLAPEELGADAVREAVRAVLHDPGTRGAAQRVAREIAAMPGPEHVARLLLRSTPDREDVR